MRPTTADVRRMAGTAWHVAQDAIEKLFARSTAVVSPVVGNVRANYIGEQIDDTATGILHEAFGLAAGEFRRVARKIECHEISWDPASVAAATAAENATTITVPGAAVGDGVIVQKPTATAGLAVGGARVSATNTVTVQLINPTAAPIDAGAETYRIFIIKR